MVDSLRDGHQNRVYAAQAMVFSSVSDLGDAREVQQYCDKVVRSAKFKKLWEERHPIYGRVPPAKVPAAITRGEGARAYVHSRRIEIGSRRRCKWIVLHELAHVLCPGDEGHGRLFARTYLELVRRFLPEHADALLTEYKARKIKYRKETVK